MKDLGVVYSLRKYDIHAYEYESGKEAKLVTVYRFVDSSDSNILPSKAFTTLTEAVHEVLLKSFEDILDLHDSKVFNLKQQIKGLEKRLDKSKEISYLEKRLNAVKEEIENLRDDVTDIYDEEG